MNFRSPGAGRRRVETTLELTPLIDVIFLLLIFFVMTTSPGMRAAERLDVALPEAESTDGGGQVDDRAVLRVYADGTVVLQRSPDHPEESIDDLRATLDDLYERAPQTPIWIRGDVDATHGAVIEILDAARQVGFDRVHMAVRPPT
jgi:biopolymer transport protein ExbD